MVTPVNLLAWSSRVRATAFVVLGHSAPLLRVVHSEFHSKFHSSPSLLPKSCFRIPFSRRKLDPGLSGSSMAVSPSPQPGMGKEELATKKRATRDYFGR